MFRVFSWFSALVEESLASTGILLYKSPQQYVAVYHCTMREGASEDESNRIAHVAPGAFAFLRFRKYARHSKRVGPAGTAQMRISATKFFRWSNPGTVA